jgi:hypothetical protein
MKKRITVGRTVLGLVAIVALSAAPVGAMAAPSDPAPAPDADTHRTSLPTSPPVASPPVASPPGLSPPPPLVPPSDPVAVLPPRSESSVTRRSVALVVAGVAVAAASAGTVFGILALQNKKDYEGSPTYSNSDRGNDDAAYADGCIALAVAAGVTGLVLYLTRDPRHDADPTASSPRKRSAELSVSPLLLSPLAHGGGAGVLLRF